MSGMIRDNSNVRPTSSPFWKSAIPSDREQVPTVWQVAKFLLDLLVILKEVCVLDKDMVYVDVILFLFICEDDCCWFLVA